MNRARATARTGTPSDTRATLLDAALAIFLGTALALVLFLGLSGAFRP